jgi:hypothetical protein
MREIPHAEHAPSLCNPAPGRVPNLHIVVNQFIWLRIQKKNSPARMTKNSARRYLYCNW